MKKTAPGLNKVTMGLLEPGHLEDINQSKHKLKHKKNTMNSSALYTLLEI